MKLTILYDNEAKEGLEKAWGFSCIIENEKKTLFDTGWDGNLLVSNMRKLGINPEDIDLIIISHDDWDHIGGLATILNLNKSVEVFCLESFSERLKGEIKNRARLREVSTATKITSDIYTTGELGSDIKEQSLVVKTMKGNIIVTGCAHPDLESIISKSMEFGKVHGIIGGFHGFSDYPILKDMELIIPCHCTQHKNEIKERYPEKCEIGFAGKIIEVPAT